MGSPRVESSQSNTATTCGVPTENIRLSNLWRERREGEGRRGRRDGEKGEVKGEREEEKEEGGEREDRR